MQIHSQSQRARIRIENDAGRAAARPFSFLSPSTVSGPRQAPYTQEPPSQRRQSRATRDAPPSGEAWWRLGAHPYGPPSSPLVLLLAGFVRLSRHVHLSTGRRAQALLARLVPPAEPIPLGKLVLRVDHVLPAVSVEDFAGLGWGTIGPFELLCDGHDKLLGARGDGPRV